MKLRIDPKRIRFRLSLEELTGLSRNGIIEQAVPISPSQFFKYKVVILEHATQLELSYNFGVLQLAVSNILLSQLIDNPSKQGLLTTVMFEGKVLEMLLQAEQDRCETS